MRLLECEAGAERTGLYFTCINSYLSPEEVAYIVNDSDGEGVHLDGGQARRRVAAAALCPNVERWLMIDADRTRRPVRAVRRSDGEVPDRPRRQRDARRGDAVFVGHHRSAEGHPAPAARHAPGEMLPALHGAEVHVRLPGRHALPVARAAVPLGTAGEHLGSDAPWRDVRDHGALRSGAVPRTGRASTRSPTRRSCPRCSRAC